jgi:peptidyl-prolyl cis-trans isomerase C
MKRFCLWPLVITFCFFALWPTPGTVLGEDVKKESKPVNAAMVNGKPIATQDFEWELGIYERRMKAQGNPAAIDDKVRAEVLDDMINRELIYQKATQAGITVTDQWKQEEMAAFKMRFSDPKQYADMLAQMNITEERLTQQFARQQVIREFIGKEIVPKVNISDKDAKDYYDKNAKQFMRPEEVKAQHILLKVEQGATEEQKTEARKKLTGLKKQIDAGADFGELAKANSQCPSAPNGGDLGYFSKGRMVPEFENAAFALKPNEVSGIVETQFGYHLIKAVEHKASQQQSFDEAKMRITNELRNKKIQADAEAFAAELRKNAKIEILKN